MTVLDQLLADPVDEERRRGRSLPAAVHGVLLPVTTTCGIVSRSASQTSWAVLRARYRFLNRPDGTLFANLTDDDVVFLLLNGWTP